MKPWEESDEAWRGEEYQDEESASFGEWWEWYKRERKWRAFMKEAFEMMALNLRAIQGHMNGETQRELHRRLERQVRSWTELAEKMRR